MQLCEVEDLLAMESVRMTGTLSSAISLSVKMFLEARYNGKKYFIKINCHARLRWASELFTCSSSHQQAVYEHNLLLLILYIKFSKKQLNRWATG